MAKKTDVARVVEAVDKKYELMLILQPDMLESTLDKKLREFEKYLEDNGGKVDMKDVWGKREFAYRIGKHSAGIYVAFNLTLPTTFNQELDEHMRIDKDIIRFLLISLKDNYEYTKFKEEEVKKEEPKKKEDMRPSGRTSTTTHKASSKDKTPMEIKDKGKKADAGSLDDKLDKLLEGDDLNI